MIINKEYTGVKIASCAGVYFRLISQPLTADEIGLAVLIVTNRAWLNQDIRGILVEVLDKAICVREPSGPVMVINPEVIVGWTTLHLYHKDINNRQFQLHPEQFCVPGTFDPQGTEV